MNDQQLYLAIGVPSAVALIGILVNVGYFVALNARISGLENKFDTRFDLLIGKIFEIDNRLTRVEEQQKHLR